MQNDFLCRKTVAKDAVVLGDLPTRLTKPASSRVRSRMSASAGDGAQRNPSI